MPREAPEAQGRRESAHVASHGRCAEGFGGGEAVPEREDEQQPREPTREEEEEEGVDREAGEVWHFQRQV